jgi:hypothetical protein
MRSRGVFCAVPSATDGGDIFTIASAKVPAAMAR